jgi:hypothetical protein
MRVLAAVSATVFLGPVMVVSGALAAIAILSEFVSGLNPFSSGGGPLDYLVGGWGAGPSSFGHYVAFMVGGVIAAMCWAVIAGTWRATRKTA